MAGARGRVGGWRGGQASQADATLRCTPHFQHVLIVEMAFPNPNDGVKLSNSLDQLAVVSQRDQWECLAGQSNVDV